jgi:hypothetical protein
MHYVLLWSGGRRPETLRSDQYLSVLMRISEVFGDVRSDVRIRSW